MQKPDGLRQTTCHWETHCVGIWPGLKLWVILSKLCLILWYCVPWTPLGAIILLSIFQTGLGPILEDKHLWTSRGLRWGSLGAYLLGAFQASRKDNISGKNSSWAHSFLLSLFIFGNLLPFFPTITFHIFLFNNYNITIANRTNGHTHFYFSQCRHLSHFSKGDHVKT